MAGGDNDIPVNVRWIVSGDAEGRPTNAACSHLDHARQTELSTAGVCEDCVREGTRWVHLRMCLTCGHVGCCDMSPRRHARRHWQESGHPLMRSVEPDEDWGWCFLDELLLQEVMVPGNLPDAVRD